MHTYIRIFLSVAVVWAILMPHTAYSGLLPEAGRLAEVRVELQYPQFPDGSRQSALKEFDRITISVESADITLHNVQLDLNGLNIPGVTDLTGSFGRFSTEELVLFDVPNGRIQVTGSAESLFGGRIPLSLEVVVDSTPPTAELQATFTQSPSGWTAHVVGSYSGTGTIGIVVGAFIFGTDKEGYLIERLPAPADLLQQSPDAFRVDVAIPDPLRGWYRIGFGLLLADEAGNVSDSESPTFPIVLSEVLVDHAQGGSLVSAPNYVPGGIPSGIGIPHSLIKQLPKGDYYATVFFEGLIGCPTTNYQINSFRAGGSWGHDVRGKDGAHSKATSTPVGGCMQEFHIDPTRSDGWLWGALDPDHGGASAVANLEGVPAFAICSGREACEVVVPSTPPPVPDIPTSTPGTISSVLFLPGIKGSHLYEQLPLCTNSSPLCDIAIWLPLSDLATPRLFLDSSGHSIQSVHVREGDLLTKAFGKDFYTGFLDLLDRYAASSTIGTGWKYRAAAYDWRLSLGDIVYGGLQDGVRISWSGQEEGQYLEKALQALASSSPTGRVTLITHSNGGLVAKALVEKLGDIKSAQLIDKILMVGVPQAGAPRALASLLYGDGESLPGTGPFPNALMSPARAREFALNSPMAYHFLPSAVYFTHTQAPLLRFGDGALLSWARAAFGEGVNTYEEMRRYALGLEDGRAMPDVDDTGSPNVVREPLLSYAQEVHEVLDAWTPPPGIRLYQIGGTGRLTLSGLELFEQQREVRGEISSSLLYRPLFSASGDGTVPLDSALLTPSSPQVLRETVDLSTSNYSHATLFQMPYVQNRIKEILEASLPQKPAMQLLAAEVHAPVHTLLVVLHGQAELHVGTATEIETGAIGNMQYVLLPAGELHQVEFTATADDVLTIEVQKLTRDGRVIASTTPENISVQEGSVGTFTIGGEGISVSPIELNRTRNTKTTSVLEMSPSTPRTTSPSLPTSAVASSGNISSTDFNNSTVTTPIVIEVPTSHDTEPKIETTDQELGFWSRIWILVRQFLQVIQGILFPNTRIAIYQPMI